MLSKSLALENAEHGIRINTISPGAFVLSLFKKQSSDRVSPRPHLHTTAQSRPWVRSRLRHENLPERPAHVRSPSYVLTRLAPLSMPCCE